MKTAENETTIQHSINESAKLKQILSKKLKQRRTNKLKNLTCGVLRLSKSYASMTSRQNDLNTIRQR